MMPLGLVLKMAIGNNKNFFYKNDKNFNQSLISSSSYILNEESGRKINLRENGSGSYILDVQFVGGEKTEVTVDSGAEENVCPWEWGQEFGIYEPGNWMKFRNASGGLINHWGERRVVVTSPF